MTQYSYLDITDVSKVPVTSIFMVLWYKTSEYLGMEAAHSPKTTVSIYQTTPCYIAEDCNIDPHSCETFIPQGTGNGTSACQQFLLLSAEQIPHIRSVTVSWGLLYDDECQDNR